MVESISNSLSGLSFLSDKMDKAKHDRPGTDRIYMCLVEFAT